jgi:hypothetical protein
MNYRNTEMKIDQIIGYLNDGKINLSPVFQRGHVWTVSIRRKLMQNIVLGRPIPAIFLYKEPSGTRYSYNILDGKQRLESLMLFVGTKRDDLRIPNWSNYFHPPKLRRDVSFWIQLEAKKRTFADLDEDTVRDFREYSIPTIEITLTDETTLDEIITLFVDINQQGVKVDRFSIVKAMGSRDKLLQSTFNLIAMTQKRGEDVHYRVKANEFTHVLKTLRLVENTLDNNAKVDRMWERLLEIALFTRTNEHRKPVEVLKGFIRAREQGEKSDPALKVKEASVLRGIFRFLRVVYRGTELRDLPLATDYTHFYAMITGLIAGDLPDRYAKDALTEKLIVLGRMIAGTLPKPTDRRVAGMFSKYLELSAKRTTEASRREERQQHFLDLIDAL